MIREYFSNGKLLLTGEYVVLDGVSALAIPTRFGQSLKVEPIDEPKIIWESLDEKGKVWFKASFLLKEIASPQKKEAHNDSETAKRIVQILNSAKQLNPNFLNLKAGFKVSTKLDFPRNWGLGSSSTLVNNIASWANVDAFKLLKLTFKGSGYDIAAAQHNSPILYSTTNGNRSIKELKLSWDFTSKLFFVHLNRKQNSREGIARYHSLQKGNSILFKEIDKITLSISKCTSLSEFEGLISTHEQIISNIIDQKPVKQILFPDFTRSIKSLGAWGGDFVLATGNEEERDYFRKKGFETIISFEDMIK